MVAKRKGAVVRVSDFSQENELYAPADAPVGMAEADVYAVGEGSSLCAYCGELLAWHEEACTAGENKPAEQARAEEALAPGAEQGLAPVPFAYGLGQPVQPTAAAQPHTVIWRGQVKERHPHSGLIRRVNVYQLSNGHWDCYYETDLRAA